MAAMISIIIKDIINVTLILSIVNRKLSLVNFQQTPYLTKVSIYSWIGNKYIELEGFP